MMKSKWKYLVVGVVIVVIVGGIFFVQKNKESNNPPKETETFQNEYYVNYPNVKNIVKCLNISTDKVKVLDETEERLLFCFQSNNYDQYIKTLENDGYKYELWDGTIVSMYEFDINGAKARITVLSDIDAYKEDHKDDEYLKEVTNQNIICELTKE